MKIGIDARLVCKRRGIGNSVFNLLNEYSKIESNNVYYLYTSDRDAKKLIPSCEQFIVRYIGSWPYPIWENILLPMFALFDGIVLLHCPANSGPVFLSKKIKLVLTINDLIYFLPNSIIKESKILYQRLGRRYLKIIVPMLAKNANKIIAISEYTKTDIIKYIGIREDDIEVIWLAGNRLRNISIQSNKKISDEKYIMAFGSLDPRKNTYRLIESFSIVYSESKLNLKLFLIGLSEYEKHIFDDYIRKLNLTDSVIIFGYINESQLKDLYANAFIFLYISEYEGFGLPLLEAMEMGAPVIASNVSSIPEILGDAGILVNPRMPGAVAKEILGLLNNESLRNYLIDRGFERARLFDWRLTAEKTLHIYSEVARA